MNVTGSSLSSLQSIYSTRSTLSTSSTSQSEDLSTPPPLPRGDGDHGPGGPMMDAVAQAFQSLGLSMPPPSDKARGTSTDDGSGSASTSTTDSTQSLGNDMHNLMNDLFQAIRSESSASSSSATTDSSATGGSFGAGLSALISQVASGSAPADLQSAFSRVASDLQVTGTATSAGTGDSTTPTLQAFLTNLQQSFGYGASTRSAAIGSLLSSTA